MILPVFRMSRNNGLQDNHTFFLQKFETVVGINLIIYCAHQVQKYPCIFAKKHSILNRVNTQVTIF